MHTVIDRTDVARLLLEDTLDLLERLGQALDLGLVEGPGIAGTLQCELAPGDLTPTGRGKGARNLL